MKIKSWYHFYQYCTHYACKHTHPHICLQKHISHYRCTKPTPLTSQNRQIYKDIHETFCNNIRSSGHYSLFVCCHERPGYTHRASPATPSLDSLRQTTLVQLQKLMWLWGWRRQHRPLFKRVALRNMTRGGVTSAYNDKT